MNAFIAVYTKLLYDGISKLKENGGDSIINIYLRVSPRDPYRYVNWSDRKRFGTKLNQN